MANADHLKLLQEGGVETWNRWREENPGIRPDLSDANLAAINLSEARLYRANLSRALLLGGSLSGAYLYEANLSRADLSEANLSGAHLSGANLFETSLARADLSGANLSGANLTQAYLSNANLSGTNLSSAWLSRANLFRADLSGQTNLSGASLTGADLTEAILTEATLISADLRRATLVSTNLQGADLTGAMIHGASVWDIQLEGAVQKNLVITPLDSPQITVDNLEVAQFIYLLLKNEKIRKVIDTITTKVVLILGRFTSERKVILDAIREELRRRGYLPVLFDFDKPESRDTVETISTLAHMARFVIVDLSAAKSVLQELQRIVPSLPSVPIQPLLIATDSEPGMLDHIKQYPWFLPSFEYNNQDHLLASLDSIITPAEEWRQSRNG